MAQDLALLMNEREFLQRCKDVVGDTSDAPWTRECLAGFFQHFRPDGDRLESFFADIPAGPEIYRRLREFYRATAVGWRRPDATDLYFVVHHPRPSTPDELIRYATAQLSNWNQMATEIRDGELVDALTPIPAVAFSTDELPKRNPTDKESLDVLIYDCQTNWLNALIRLSAHASWMRHAFYSIACNYAVAAYVTWPWYTAATSIKDPFKAYFNLWLRGAALRCQSRTSVVVYAPARDKWPSAVPDRPA